MKHINTYSVALSMLASLLFAGCVKEEWTEDRRIPGDRRISFSVGETYAERTGTRTAYSGVTQQTDGTAFRIGEQPAERIDWVDGDRICIWSDKATYGSADRHYGDYLIKTHTTQEALSSATVTALGGELTWGEGYHHFFAVYPSPSVVDPQGDGTQTLADNGRLVIPDVGAGDDIWQFRAYIPSTQTLTWEGNVGVPDMTYAYMCASLDGVTPNENSTVTLYFKPAVSAFRFTIDGTDETPQQLSSFQLKSEYGPIAGNYNVRMGGTTEQDALPYWSMGFECPSNSADEENSDTITVDLTGKSVSASSSITFTVFTFPETGNLTIVLNFADGKSKSLDLKYGDGSWVPFPACSKSNLTSLKAPSLERGIPDFRFSVSDTKQVYFSSGNLQYQVGAGDGPDATTANGTWYFAPQEWVPIGYPNEANIAAIAAGTAPEGTRIDLFAFGTSGKEYGAGRYLPWQIYGTNAEEESAYGMHVLDYSFSGDGDWGTHPIENAKLPVDVYLGGGGYDAAPLVRQGWYTLEYDDSQRCGWNYLMSQRKNADRLRGIGRIWDEAAGRYYNGAILLPDDWYDKNLDPLLNLNTTLSQFGEFVLLQGTYYSDGHYSDNTYRISDWQVMQSMGAVFFPASGIMMDHSSSIGGPGLYDDRPHYTKITEQNKDDEFMFSAVWSSTSQSAMYSMALAGLGFAPWSSSEPNIHYAHWHIGRSMAIPVRLVRDADYIEPVYSLEVRDITVEKGGNPVTAQAVVKDAAGNPILAEVTWTDLTSGNVIPRGSTVALSNGGTTVSVTPGALTDAGQLTVSAPASSADGFVCRMRASILVNGFTASSDFNVAVAGFDLSVSPERSGIWEGETITIDAQAYSGSTPVGKDVAWTIEGNGNGHVTEVSRTATSITLRGSAFTIPGSPVTVKATADENAGIQASATLIVRQNVHSDTFRVDTDKQVYFAPGTLQYVFGSGDASLPAGADATGTWRFAEHQYDFVKAADNLSRMKTRRAGEVIDLFHWGATGINYEDGQYYLPWTLDKEADDAKFGPSSGLLSGDSEWGVHTITNGVPQTGWRTMSRREWSVLSTGGYYVNYNTTIPGRTGYRQLYGFGTVDGIKGFVFLPDGFVQPGGMKAFVTGVEGFSYFPVKNNAYTLEEWSLMEQAGAVFMPAHGSIRQMYGSAVDEQETYYRNSLSYQTTSLYWWGGFSYFRCTEFNSDPATSTVRYRGDKIPVRLVIDAPAGDEGLNAALQQTGFVLSRYTQKTGVTVLYNGTDVTASATVSWSIDNSSVATMAVTPNSAGVAGAGITVTPVAAGNATITCSVTYGGQTKVLTAGVIVSQ